MIFSIIKTIKSLESTNDKKAFLEKHKENALLRLVLEMTYNKRDYNYGIATKGFPETNVFEETSDNSNLHEKLLRIRHTLCSREKTGSAAINWLQEQLEQLSSEQQHVVELIFKRDLDCGIGPALINATFDNLIPEQPQMLASSENIELIEAILKKGNAVAELKADGSRNHVVIEDGEPIRMYTRNGSQYTGLTKIEQLLNSSIFTNIVIDGEIVYRSRSGANREEGNGIVNKSIQGTISEAEADELVFQVWDFIPIDVYYGRTPSIIPLHERRKCLEEFVASIGSDRIVIIEQTPVKTVDDVRKVYRKYVDDGFEGIILKDGNSVWENKRSKNIVKFKEKIRIDLRVIDVYPHKKDPNKVGGFTVKSDCGRIVSDVGSGFTDTTKIRDKKTKQWLIVPFDERGDLDREYLWTMRDQLIDTIWEIEINNVTTKKNRKETEPEFKLSFPVIKSRRYDKSKANTLVEVFPKYEDKPMLKSPTKFVGLDI